MLVRNELGSGWLAAGIGDFEEWQAVRSGPPRKNPLQAERLLTAACESR